MPAPFDIATLELEPESEALRLLERFPDCQCIKFRDQEYLIRQEEETEDIFLVLKGALVVEQLAMGASLDLPATQLATMLCSPENLAFFGEMAYLGSQSRSASVKSAGASFCLKLRPEHIDAIIQHFPGLTRTICRQFSQRLKEADGLLTKWQARFNLHAQSRIFMPDEPVIQEGQAANALYQLVTGRVRLTGKGEGRSVGPEELPKGFLNHVPFLQNTLQDIGAVALEPAFIVTIQRRHIEAFIRTHPDLVLGLCQKCPD